MKPPSAILALALKPKGKAAESDEEEAAEPEAKESHGGEYKALIKDSAEAGDWDAFADAVAGYVRTCAGKA
jgi:hypothetical protein